MSAGVFFFVIARALPVSVQVFCSPSVFHASDSLSFPFPLKSWSHLPSLSHFQHGSHSISLQMPSNTNSITRLIYCLSDGFFFAGVDNKLSSGRICRAFKLNLIRLCVQIRLLSPRYKHTHECARARVGICHSAHNVHESRARWANMQANEENKYVWMFKDIYK